MIVNKQTPSLVLTLLVSLATLSCTDKSSEVIDIENNFKKAVEKPAELSNHTQTPVIHSLKALDEATNSAPNKLNAEAISKDEPEPTLTDRKKWYGKLAWDKSCEDGYQAQRFATGGDYGGIYIHTLDDARLLIEVLCAEGDGGDWPWDFSIYFIHNTKTSKTSKLKLPGYKAESSEEMRLDYTPVYGSSKFNKQTKTLSLMQEYRKIGDCGLYAEYQFNKNNEIIVTAAYEKSCIGLGEDPDESEFDVKTWPTVQLTDHSESEWRGDIDEGTDYMGEEGILEEFNATCVKLTASENPAKKAQGYQCQAWAIMAKDWEQTASIEVLDLSAKAIALMPKDKSLYANRFKLVEDKDKAAELSKALAILPNSVNIEYWLEQAEAYNTSEDRHADILNYVQMLNKTFPNDYRIFNKLAMFSNTDEHRLKFYEESYKQEPDQPITMIRLARLYNWDTDTQKVNKLFSKAFSSVSYEKIEEKLGLVATSDYIKFLSTHMDDDAQACAIMHERLGENASFEGLVCP